MKQLFKDTVLVSIDDIVPDPNNPNKMTKEQAKSLVYSMEKFDDVMPIVVDSKSMMVADGHHRLAAYKAMGVKEIHVIKKDFKNSTERILFSQTMNKLRGQHDKSLDIDVVYALVNGSEENLLDYMRLTAIEDERTVWDYLGKDLMSTNVETTKPTVEDEQTVDAILKYGQELKTQDIITKVGDIWSLGNHRLLCGDFSDKEAMKRLTENKLMDMVFVDPPYNMMGSSNGMVKMDDDNILVPFYKGLFDTIKHVSKTDAHVYVFCNWRSYHTLHSANKQVGLTPKNLIVWHKPNSRLGSMYSSSHELIWFLANEVHTGRISNTRLTKTRTVYGETNVWVYGNNTSTLRDHFAEKLLILPQRAIGNSTEIKESVMDMCMGSGTTLIACESTDRVCYGVEIEPRYCDVVVKRWEQFTGRKAEKVPV